MESTIIKLENDTISFLRPGYIGETEILSINNGLESNKIKILTKKVHNSILDSPGQLSLHYCPNAPVYIFNIVDFGKVLGNKTIPNEVKDRTKSYLNNTILIDFNSIYYKYSSKFLGYVDLSLSDIF